jgi:hypothetical protein
VSQEILERLFPEYVDLIRDALEFLDEHECAWGVSLDRNLFVINLINQVHDDSGSKENC